MQYLTMITAKTRTDFNNGDLFSITYTILILWRVYKIFFDTSWQILEFSISKFTKYSFFIKTHSKKLLVKFYNPTQSASHHSSFCIFYNISFCNSLIGSYIRFNGFYPIFKR